LQQDEIELRHIGPLSSIWPAPPADVSTFALLGQSAMVARKLPISNVPATPDFVSGSWTGRLGDAGEATLLFPNATSSDGVPWRERFDPTGHLQFIEVKFNGFLDFTGVIDQVTADQQQVTVHAYDAFWLLKKAYVRDWIVTQAPRDVIERGTQVWVPTIVDSFPAGTLNAQWTAVSFGTASAVIGAQGGLSLTATSSGATETVESGTISVAAGTQVWSASCSFQNYTNGNFQLQVVESSGDAYNLTLPGFGAGTNLPPYLTSLGSGAVGHTQPVTSIQVASATSYEFSLESDGEWISGYVNGQLVGTIRRNSDTTSSLQLSMELFAVTSSSALTVTGVLLESLQPFLMRGSDKGDYVLPGDASTYSSGGLHARYFNDLDLQFDSNRLSEILAPPRTQAYGGSSPQEYANQQDATINLQANPTPGAATSNWSARWFGAIYLKLSAGDYSFNIITGVGASNTAVRVWVGKTRFGDQLVGQWAFNSQTSYLFTVSASALAGTLPYGAGTVQRDGWYPIIIEYAVDANASTAPQFVLASSPAAYTDPGGTAIASGAQSSLVPATSLSPLGCVDQRYQGIAHFDLVQQTLQAVGYQAAVEPQQLESASFPGVLAPRIREGHDTDLVLKPDAGPRQDGEGLLNYSSTLDSSDFASSLQGNGAGFQSGTTGQLQGHVYDPDTMLASLFDAQGWQDFSDASFESLLQALLNSQLGLQLEPWQLLSADPNGRPRKAFTWPLPGALAQMRWRPGDGLQVQARLINVNDTAPRQMLVITRNISPRGVTSTQGTFANRPKNPARALKRQLYTATRLQRNYQRQAVTLTGNYAVDGFGGGTLSPAISQVSLSPGDQIIGATLRVNVNSVPESFSVVVNGSLVGLGPWTAVPIVLDITSVATPDSNNRLNIQLFNNSSSVCTYEWQVFVDVLR